MKSLFEAAQVFSAENPEPSARPQEASTTHEHANVDDLCDISGQLIARRALEIAAAGGHHLLLCGPPGAGKTMLAKRLPSILPPLNLREALEAFALAAQMPAAQMDHKTMMKDGAMTMSGCIAAGMDGKGYMLNNAMHVSMPMVKPTDTPSMSPGHMMSYALAGADVKGHMGHKVELTGTLSKADKDRMDKMMKMDQKDKDKMMADPKMKAMKFTVTSIKMVSATCS